MKERLKAYETSKKFYERFQAETGSVLCKELIGFDLSVPEQRDKAAKTHVFEEKCTVFVTKACEILLELTQSPG
jgi:hypothetical protein